MQYVVLSYGMVLPGLRQGVNYSRYLLRLFPYCLRISPSPLSLLPTRISYAPFPIAYAYFLRPFPYCLRVSPTAPRCFVLAVSCTVLRNILYGPTVYGPTVSVSDFLEVKAHFLDLAETIRHVRP
eukprot:217328-Rhodomonas_salina.1